MITLTEQAGKKVQSLLEAEQKLTTGGLRIYVSGGGCHGFQYGMSIEEQAREEDTVIESGGVKVFVDPHSLPVLQGLEIDYIDSLQGAGFAIKNPNAKSSCGCGSSFSA